MSFRARLPDRARLVAWLIALALHGGLALVAGTRPAAEPAKAPPPVEITVVREEPEPTPPPAPPPPKPKPRPAAPPPDTVVDLTKAPPEAAEPPPTQAAADAPADAAPVFGLSAESFGKSGALQLRRGNTLAMQAADSPITTEVSALRPVPVYAVSKLPEILGSPDPKYPPDLRAAGIEGDVVVELIVTAEGEVGAGSLQVLESSNGGFDEAAVEAVAALRFRPATQGSTPVAVRIRIPVRFRLR
jgi:protein TonB